MLMYIDERFAFLNFHNFS